MYSVNGLATKIPALFTSKSSAPKRLVASLPQPSAVSRSAMSPSSTASLADGSSDAHFDARRDVALIKAESRGRRPLAVRRAPVVLGEGVFAIGTPLEETLQNTMTKGIVSAQQRVFDGLPFIQSDVGVTHGNSGGPLLDEKGAVIGLTASGREINGAPVGLNFFIPIDDALKALAITPAN